MDDSVSPPATRGLFISFEGGECCGKTTQISKLVTRFVAAGRKATVIRDPGGTYIGETVRDLLQHQKGAEGMCPETEILLFAASRAQLVREVVEPALARGDVVIADRFIDSTTAYQGGGRGLPLRYIEWLNTIAAGDTLPAVTVFLNIDEAEAARRAASRPPRWDRLEAEAQAFHKRVRAAYRRMVTRHARFLIVDGAGTPEDVHAQVCSGLSYRGYL